MPSIPLFIVTSIKERKRQANANAYSSRQSTEPLWQVRMQSGFFAGVGVTFMYPDKQKADVFAPWELYNPGQIIQEAAPKGEPFTVQDIYKSRGYGAKNLYTDKRKVLESWTVSMEGAYGDYLDLWYPTPGEAAQFGKGMTYTLQDIFGTVKAPLFEMGVQLEAAIGAARQAIAEEDANRKAQQQQQYHQQLLANQANWAQQAGLAGAEAATAEAAAQAAATAGSNLALSHGATAAEAAAVANSILLNTTSTLLLSVSGGSAYFWVTDGGAAGWYGVGTAAQMSAVTGATWAPGVFVPGSTVTNNGAIGPLVYQETTPKAELTHYASGTFNNPANGILLGAFVSDASYAAGSVQPYS